MTLTLLDHRARDVRSNLCKACGICVALCPRDVFDGAAGAVPIVARPKDCNGCRICEVHCPDFAIRIERLAAEDDSAEEVA